MGEAGQSLLRRMAGKADAPTTPDMTIQRALRHAFARAGSQALGVAVNAQDPDEAIIAPDDVAENLPDPALFIRLNGAGLSGGVAIACAQVVSAVIEAQTIGSVLKS